MRIPHEWLGVKRLCVCGAEHKVPIEKIVIDENMLQLLTEYLIEQSYFRVLLVADSNTYAAFGKQVFECLSGVDTVDPSKILLSSCDLLPDEIAVAAVRDQISRSAIDVVLAVGSGVINDIARYASFLDDIPYIVVPTAASMDGYASSVAAMQFQGVKVTFPTQTPKAIFVHPAILAAAPFELIQAGFGDVIGKITSLLDWKLSNILFEEPFCTTCYEMVLEPLKYCIDHSEELRHRQQDAVQMLFIGLINAGVAMAMIGNSRPCSGSEHHCSHYWDLLAFQNKRPHMSHGLQVGYATRWTIRFYQLLADLEEIISPAEPRLTVDEECTIREFYQDGAEEIMTVFRDKQKWYLEHHGDFLVKDMRLLLAKLEPEWSLLTSAGAAILRMELPSLPESLHLDVSMLRQTFLHARELRARYTIFDFYESQHRLMWAVSKILDEDAGESKT